MKRSAACLVALVLALSPALALAQVHKDDATKLDLLEGRVVRVDKENETLEVRQSGPTGVTWTVAYDDKTYFSHRNEASSLDKLENGKKVICLGEFNEGNKMMAKRIDMREGS
jgi:hypothetical protein